VLPGKWSSQVTISELSQFAQSHKPSCFKESEVKRIFWLASLAAKSVVSEPQNGSVRTR
jgi:hypothetical protein